LDARHLANPLMSASDPVMECVLDRIGIHRFGISMRSILYGIK
jgi:hypothetical protein